MSVKPSVVVFLVAVLVHVFVVLIIRPVKEQIFVTIFVLDCFSITTLVGAHKLQKWRSAVNVKSDAACNARLITFCQPVFGINLR